MSSAPPRLLIWNWGKKVSGTFWMHQQAVQLFQRRLGEGRQFVTSSVVLLEVGNWLVPFLPGYAFRHTIFITLPIC